MATIIDGKAVAAKVKQEAAERVAKLKEKGRSCGLAVVLVGDDPASAVYVRNKRRDCVECGIEALDYDLPATCTQEELEELLSALNADPTVSGILVQMPLPGHLDPERAIAHISPEKDVDGFHPVNLGRLMRGLDGPRPCTPTGVMRLLREYDIPVAGRQAVVLGRSTIVGKPMALMLMEEHATVTICHSKTPNAAETSQRADAGRQAVVLGRSTIVGKPMALMLMEEHATVTICHSKTPNAAETSQRADIVISAIGRPNLVKANWMAPGATVIDVGMNRDENGKLCGDVDYAEVEPIAGAITPVPGGVGPMTRAMLMLNTVTAAERLAGMATLWPR